MVRLSGLLCTRDEEMVDDLVRKGQDGGKEGGREGGRAGSYRRSIWAYDASPSLLPLRRRVASFEGTRGEVEEKE